MNRPINRLLAALPYKDYQRLCPHLELIELSQYEILYSVGKPYKYAYFPNQSIIFSMAIMENGSPTDIGVIGNEGMLGLPIILNTSDTKFTAIVQVSGYGYRIAAEHLQEELSHQEALKNILMCYVQTRIIQLGQTAACNHHHSLEQRFARWLLTVRDNIQQDEFWLSYESISQVLGVCYITAAEIVEKIQRTGIIDIHQGKVEILDHQALEKATCECYQVIKKWSTISHKTHLRS